MASDSPSTPRSFDAPYPQGAVDQPGKSRFREATLPLSNIRLMAQEAYRATAIEALQQPSTQDAVKAALGRVVLGPRPEQAGEEALGMSELYDETVESLYKDMLDAPAGAAHIVELKSETRVVLADGDKYLPLRPRHLTAVNVVALDSLNRAVRNGGRVIFHVEALGDFETRGTLLSALEQGVVLAEHMQDKAVEQPVASPVTARLTGRGAELY